nr:MAG TPA: hypothetical protein [Caudoviricetes sp.]
MVAVWLCMVGSPTILLLTHVDNFMRIRYTY